MSTGPLSYPAKPQPVYGSKSAMQAMFHFLIDDGYEVDSRMDCAQSVWLKKRTDGVTHLIELNVIDEVESTFAR